MKILGLMGKGTSHIGWKTPGRSKSRYAGPSTQWFGRSNTSRSSESWTEIAAELILWLDLDRAYSGA